jgi:hypothetical protein
MARSISGCNDENDIKNRAEERTAEECAGIAEELCPDCKRNVSLSEAKKRQMVIENDRNGDSGAIRADIMRTVQRHLSPENGVCILHCLRCYKVSEEHRLTQMRAKEQKEQIQTMSRRRA